MHDLKFLRDNPDAFDAALARRGLEPVSAALLKLDAERRALITKNQNAQERRNALSKEIGQLKARGENGAAEGLMAEVNLLKSGMATADMLQEELSKKLDDFLLAIPNVPAADVPDGADETSNVERGRHGTPRVFAFPPQHHYELGERLDLMDFETASKISGARFVILKGALARLERALSQFMLDQHTQHHGYTEVSPPFLVKSPAALGTGNLPKFADDLFTTGEHWLIPTAEVPLTNMVRETIVDERELPLRFTACTPCFRAEAGAAGRDTRGMIRLHQFTKVELVSVTTPDQSEAEHERMLTSAAAILNALELPFRIVTLCAGDMGFASRKTYDIEVWLPAQNAYREISSCSNCGDFQARRMNARCKSGTDKGTRFLHTLNGSGVAVGRCLVAVLENYQQEGGSIAIPSVLQNYMDGVKAIGGVANGG